MLDSMYRHLYGSHPIPFIIKKNALIQSNKKQVHFNSIGYLEFKKKTVLCETE